MLQRDVDFSQFSCRWRPKTFVRDELYALIRNAVEDSYKRLILPLLTRSYRYLFLHRHHRGKCSHVLFVSCFTSFHHQFQFSHSSPASHSPRVVRRTKLTSAAEKESIAMFVRNLRQRLLVCPVRGCVIMGVDPGFKHGCKLAVLSPTSEWQHCALLNSKDLCTCVTGDEADCQINE